MLDDVNFKKAFDEFSKAATKLAFAYEKLHGESKVHTDKKYLELFAKTFKNDFYDAAHNIDKMNDEIKRVIG